MATDNWGQTIPSWVEDNSYECATMQTITQNDAHPTPMTSAQFCTMMKESGDKYIVRDGIVKDSDWMDGKFIEDGQRTYTGVDGIAQKDEMLAKYGATPDGNPKATLSFSKGVDENDTSNWGPAQWLGNSGLDAYMAAYVYKNGSTVVANTETFDSVEVKVYWKYIDDYKKAITGEVNPIATISSRVIPDASTNKSTAANISPSNEEVSLEDFGRGEDYKFKTTCVNDFLVSGAAMKYKKEWLKGGSHETASLIDSFLIANGMGRTANLNTWVTHCCTTLGQPRTTKDVLNFVGGQNLPIEYRLNSDFELKGHPPELVPYQIVPLDPVPDCRLELGIELIYPQSIMNMPEPQKEETLEYIYKRVAYEISNPDKTAGLFQVDGRMYHLIRIPYTGASNFWGWE